MEEKKAELIKMIEECDNERMLMWIKEAIACIKRCP